MPYDANAIMQSQTTANGTQSSPVYDFKTTPGTPQYGMAVRVRQLSAAVATATLTGATYYYQVMQSASSSGSPSQNAGQSPTFTLGTGIVTATSTIGTTTSTSTITNASEQIVDIPFILTQRYALLELVLSASTGAPSIVYASEIGATVPG